MVVTARARGLSPDWPPVRWQPTPAPWDDAFRDDWAQCAAFPPRSNRSAELAEQLLRTQALLREHGVHALAFFGTLLGIKRASTLNPYEADVRGCRAAVTRPSRGRHAAVTRP